jgi:hypothetical protein
MSTHERPISTTAALRGDIDSGQTGDKISHPDPAAAPLGTDDEAGGAPMKNSDAAAAHAYETGRNVPTKRPDQTGPWVWAVIAGVLLVMAAAVAVIYWPAPT